MRAGGGLALGGLDTGRSVTRTARRLASALGRRCGSDAVEPGQLGRLGGLGRGGMQWEGRREPVGACLQGQACVRVRALGQRCQVKAGCDCGATLRQWLVLGLQTQDLRCEEALLL